LTLVLLAFDLVLRFVVCALVLVAALFVALVANCVVLVVLALAFKPVVAAALAWLRACKNTLLAARLTLALVLLLFCALVFWLALCLFATLMVRSPLFCWKNLDCLVVVLLVVAWREFTEVFVDNLVVLRFCGNDLLALFARNFLMLVTLGLGVAITLFDEDATFAVTRFAVALFLLVLAPLVNSLGLGFAEDWMLVWLLSGSDGCCFVNVLFFSA